ncbi:MAG: phage virion morphogenesis protein [Pseudomonas sp.]
MASASLDLSGLPGLRAALDRLTDFSRPLKTVALLLNAEARKSFVGQQAPDSTPWARFKHPPSVKRGGPAAKLLRDTGLLMASLTARGGRHVENVTATTLEWGSNVPYAGIHQFGTRHIRARPFVGLTPTVIEKTRKIVLEYLEKGR